MIYSQKTALERRNLSRFEREMVKKLQAKKQTRWMIPADLK